MGSTRLGRLGLAGAAQRTLRLMSEGISRYCMYSTTPRIFCWKRKSTPSTCGAGSQISAQRREGRRESSGSKVPIEAFVTFSKAIWGQLGPTCGA